MRKDPLYFIAILPPEHIQSEITAFKNHIADTWGPRHALRSPPHITLQAPFAWPDDRLPELRACLGDFAKQQSRFDVHLKNFDTFPPRVIFVDQEPGKELNALFEQLIQCLESNLGFRAPGRGHLFRPHMTIAHRDLKPADFPEVWAHFQGMNYKRAFTVDGICLLKLVERKWQIVAQFIFQ